MFKKIFLLGSFIFVNSAVPMENQINSRNVFGHTPLHYCSMLPEEIINCYLPHKDEPLAALLISHQQSLINDLPKRDAASSNFAGKGYWMGADIYIKDNSGLSAWDYAQKNKNKLPNVFKVFNAVNIINTAKGKLPKTDSNGAYSWDQLANMHPMSDQELIQWAEAEAVLAPYKN